MKAKEKPDLAARLITELKTYRVWNDWMDSSSVKWEVLVRIIRRVLRKAKK